MINIGKTIQKITTDTTASVWDVGCRKGLQGVRGEQYVDRYWVFLIILSNASNMASFSS